MGEPAVRSKTSTQRVWRAFGPACDECGTFVILVMNASSRTVTKVRPPGRYVDNQIDEPRHACHERQVRAEVPSTGTSTERRLRARLPTRATRVHVITMALCPGHAALRYVALAIPTLSVTSLCT